MVVFVSECKVCSDSVYCFTAPEDSGPGGDTDQGNLLNTIADSNQVLSVISDAGDHVLKLSFMDSSPLNQSTFSTKRYTYN